MKYLFCCYIDKPQRVDMYLSALFSDFSRSYVQKLIDTEKVFINGKKLSKNKKIQRQDIVEIYVTITESKILAQDIPLEIIYEDNDFLLINKEAGINTHPTPGIEWKRGTLVNAVLHHCWNNLPVINGEQRPGIVHRLDKDTSGVIIIAKNDIAMKNISLKIKNREVDKYYIALVQWIVPEKKITITSYIWRHKHDRTRMTTVNPINPKEALTHGEVLWYIDNKITILYIKLETGRTHQIRVHLSSIGYPIIGDKVYGNQEENRKILQQYWLSRQALHAYKLSFFMANQSYNFIAPLKSDMKKIIPQDIFNNILAKK